MVETSRCVAFERGGVSVFIEMANRTAAECLAEVDAARAVLLRHVEAEKPAAVVPALPTFDEWVAVNGGDKDLLCGGYCSWCNYGGPTRRLPDDVYMALQGFMNTGDGRWRIYESEDASQAALRSALLRLGKIRGGA